MDLVQTKQTKVGIKELIPSGFFSTDKKGEEKESLICCFLFKPINPEVIGWIPSKFFTDYLNKLKSTHNEWLSNLAFQNLSFRYKKILTAYKWLIS